MLHELRQSTPKPPTSDEYETLRIAIRKQQLGVIITRRPKDWIQRAIPVLEELYPDWTKQEIKLFLFKVSASEHDKNFINKIFF